jgi:putative MATE family efflux protein
MQDLTTGSITRHLLKTTGFMLVMMVFQTLYFLVDLYWVGRLGTAAVAGVAIAGNLTFIVLALTQMLGVGTTAVVAHAVGRKDQRDAQHLFNQSLVLSAFVAVAFLAIGLLGRDRYLSAMTDDPATWQHAASYLGWFIPAMALQFPLAVMGSSLRGIGQFKPTMLVSTTSVIVNMAVAPFLIFGWGTGRAFGVAGAAIASLIAIIIALAWMASYFVPRTAYLHIRFSDWKPHFGQWRRVLAIGLPTGFEFAMMAAYQAFVYTIAKPFGAPAQAAFGIGMRIIQAGFMPVVALGFAVAPVAGQNFGARMAQRVKATFGDAALLATGAMILLTILCESAPGRLLHPFSRDATVIAAGTRYLRIISWNFVASGIIFVASSLFQAMGNTMPSLIASAVRITIVVVPGLALARQPGFGLHWIWYLSAAAVWVQLSLSLLLLRREFGRRLTSIAPQSAAEVELVGDMGGV